VVISALVRRWLLTAVVAITLVAAACASDGKKAASPATQGASHHATTSTTTTLDPGEPTEPAASYGVGSRTLHLVDTSRPTKASPTRNIAASSSRKLDVLVLYPIADTEGGATPLPEAPVADGRFPVLEFSHGVTASGPVYAPFLAPIVQAGYVVAAPTFPLTSGAGAWSDLSDYVNQPADVSFVLDNVLGLDTKTGDPLDGHLATHEVAVAGHSLGAMTTYGFANSCCAEPRAKAMIAMSGVEPPFPGGDYTHPPKGLPALLIHGTADGTVPYRGSTAAFANLTAPRAFLTFPGASHTDVVANQQDAPVSEQAIEAFLALELRHDDTAWKALPAKTTVGSIQVAGGLPAPGA
jgi:predicted dienelactone hydrolase